MAAEVGGMSDERLCAHMIWDDSCGEHEGAEIHQDRARWNYHPFKAAPLCPACSGRQMVFVQGPNASHPCEHCRGTGIEPAAPSTDAGEARKGHECDAWCVFQSWVSEIRGGASNTDDLGLRSAFDAIAAEAREPLEERIRELEAARDRVRDALPEMLEMAGGGEFLTGLWAQRLLDSHNRAKDAEAEVERLREALRDALDTLLDYVPQRAKPYRNGWVDEWRALATPPSSTEGTKEVEG